MTSRNNAHLSNVSALSYIKHFAKLQQSRTQKILQQLRKEYLIKKYCAATSQPHNKYLYISRILGFFAERALINMIKIYQTQKNQKNQKNSERTGIAQ